MYNIVGTLFISLYSLTHAFILIEQFVKQSTLNEICTALLSGVICYNRMIKKVFIQFLESPYEDILRG